MQLSKLLLWTFLVLNWAMMVACTLPKPQEREGEGSDTATFLISEATGEGGSTKLNKDFSVPESKLFNFSVCVKDRAQSKPLVGHPFKVDEINKEKKTDEKGCLNWQERVSFNYFAEPQYLTWERHITATGLHKGTRLARFAINPWSDTDNSKAVVNLNTATPPKLESDPEKVQAILQNKSQETNPAKHSLWVNDMRIQTYDQKFTEDGAVILNLDLMAVPRLKVKALNGDPVFQPLNQGKFKVKLYMIHAMIENNKEVRRILSETDTMDLSVYGANLFIKAPLKMPVIPSRGQLILGMDITPIDTALEIGNFQGVYLIGDYDQLKISGFLKLMSFVTENENFKISEYINAHDKLEGKDGYVKPRVEIAPLEFQSFRIRNETTSEREVVYTVRACLRNGLDQKLMRGHTFKITGFRQKEGEQGPVYPVEAVTTDNTSCLNWSDVIKVKYYECQKSIEGYIEIENKDLALKQRIRVAVNPWQSNNNAVFGRDLRYPDPKNTDFLLTDCKKEKVLPSAMSLRRISYSLQDVKYEIDNYLNMTFKKEVRLNLDAVVGKYSDMTFGRMESAEKLRPGVYLLKLAVIQNRLTPDDSAYVTSAETLVSTLDGDIKADVDLSIENLKFLGNRNTLLVELAPVLENKVVVNADGRILPKSPVKSLDELIDNSIGIYNRTFKGVMILSDDRDSQDLMPLNLQDANQYLVHAQLPKIENTKQSTVRGYIELGQKLQSEQREALRSAAGIPAFVKRNGLKLLSLSNDSSSDLQNMLVQGPTRMKPAQMTQELQQFVATGNISKELAKGFCAYWYRNVLKGEVWDTYQQLNEANCAIRTAKPQSHFKTEKRVFVKELSGFEYLKGYRAGVNVDNSISLTKSHAQSLTVSKSISFNAGLSLKWAELFSIGATGSYSIADATAESTATANAVSMRANVSMDAEQNIFRLDLKRYQECAVVTMNPRLFAKGGIFETALKPGMSDVQKIDAATRGVMICTGEDSTTPKSFNESYYFVYQSLFNTHGQDRADSRNRNFVIALRGEKEFQRLSYFLQDLKGPKDANAAGSELTNQMLNGLDTLFNTGLPNAPGSYNSIR